LALSCRIEDRASRVAFVYGISIYQPQYPEGDWRSVNLEYCDDDAASMAALLEASGYSVRRRITGLTEPTPLNPPTKESMIADLASIGPETDRAVFYYSGHGFREDSVDYLVPYGAVSPSGGILTGNMVSVDEWNSWLSSCAAGQKICIFDSCYSGGFADRGGGADLSAPIFGPADAYGPTPAYAAGDPRLVSPLLIRFMQGFRESSGALVISAAGSEELSYESGTIGHGIFTGAILDGAVPEAGSGRAKADYDSDGVVSVVEAYRHAARIVDDSWNRAYGSSYDSNVGQYADYLPHVSGGALDSILFNY
jgi:uncharacterized caspase-like protein